MSMLGDLDKDCKTLEAESWHEWKRDLCLGFPLFEKYVELLMVWVPILLNAQVSDPGTTCLQDNSFSLEYEIVSGGDSGRESAYQMRQCHSSGIYKQARGNQINTALSSFMGHDAVVFKTQHSHPCSSYSREKELSCIVASDKQILSLNLLLKLYQGIPYSSHL
jgi:hypothetical protein